MRRPPGSTICFGIWRAAIGRPYNARQLLFIPNSSFLIPNDLGSGFPLVRGGGFDLDLVAAGLVGADVVDGVLGAAL